jgi:hypothetical protein
VLVLVLLTQVKDKTVTKKTTISFGKGKGL